MITFLYPYFLVIFRFLLVFTSGSCEYYLSLCHQPSAKFDCVQNSNKIILRFEQIGILYHLCNVTLVFNMTHRFFEA